MLHHLRQALKYKYFCIKTSIHLMGEIKAEADANLCVLVCDGWASPGVFCNDKEFSSSNEVLPAGPRSLTVLVHVFPEHCVITLLSVTPGAAVTDPNIHHGICLVKQRLNVLMMVCLPNP